MSLNPPPGTFGYSAYGPYVIPQLQPSQPYVIYGGSFPMYSQANQFGHLPVSPRQFAVAPMAQHGVYPVAYVGSDAQRQSDGSSSQTTGHGSDSGVNYPVHRLTSSMAVPAETARIVEAVGARIKVKKYATSAIDPIRNYLTVFEYTVNDSWVMWDYDTGYVHLTGIWKAAFSDEVNHPIKSKCDIVKLIDSTPKEYHSYIKRIRGGFLKIQGTWLPFNLCKILARRFCYYIRYELVPLFGNDFPNYCLRPSDAGFGELRFDDIAETSTALPRKLISRVVASPSALADSPVLHRRTHSDTRRRRPRLDSAGEEFDIVEASRCLQSLSAHTLPESTYNNYTTASDDALTPEKKARTEPNGISNILRAATMSEHPRSPHRSALKINDLLD